MFFTNFFIFLFTLLLSYFSIGQAHVGSSGFSSEELTFSQAGITLSGTLYRPKESHAALVIVHGSGQELRMSAFALSMAQQGITVFTYDKRGVGASGGIYAGPEVGTNNIDSSNLQLLASDANAAVQLLHNKVPHLPLGLIGGSQAGWIIPLVAHHNPLVQFMVLFSCPTITTLEQLRFQFYTNGDSHFWDNHTEAEAREHLKNDTDRFKFEPTDPKLILNQLSIPGLWIYGEKDIQLPVKVCIEDLNVLKAKGKPFEYTLFPNLGHNTFFDSDKTPFEIVMRWIKQLTSNAHQNQKK